MDTHGHRNSNNPKATLASLLSKRQKLQEQLRNVEKQVYELETSYLQEMGSFGNALKGFDGFLSSTKNTSNLKRSRKFQLEDRLFSLSSVTSPAAEELGVGREDGRSDWGQSRARGGITATNGPGKPKKGRAAPREGKKIKLASDLDLDDEDDLDLR